MEVGTGQEGKVLCHQGILRNYHNNHHTSALEEEEARNLAGCLQRRVVVVALQELAGKLQEVLVLEVLEGMQQQQQ